MSRARRIGLLLAALALPANAAAQDYPSHPVTLVMPYSPGGGTDVVGRQITQGMERRLGQPFVVDYRPGAGSAIAATYTARSPADGYTLLYATSTTMAINVSVHKRLNYDPAKDLTPVAMMAITPFILVVNAALPIHSVGELVAAAKSKPGGLTYASNGAGGASHLFAELFRTHTGIQVTHVPYKSMTQPLNDVLGGHLNYMFSDLTPSLPLIRDGKLQALAVSTPQRAAALPQVPTVAESGYKGFEAVTWFGLLGPARLPAPVVTSLNSELNKALASPDLRKKLEDQGLTVQAGSPEQFLKLMRTDLDKWGRVVKASGARVD